jgi:hypothetical protein
MEKKDGGHCYQRGSGLQRKYLQSLSRRPRQPLDREVRHDRYLSSHQDLPQVRSGAFIGLAGNAEQCNVANHNPQGGERHNQWKKSARPLY